ncbi:bifunctional riboflavin kinase/FAD synthetase [Rhodobium gokarnense]|uniref:Riboflavin biosynthesis protein n=1 Tax=Rhodobium gokarnense TaxID=364296 RepID=A0ABT3HCM2_9HYPH|nr:bifunctional riboflavin kinase/FAD synthetase [Rhodobium gokarnense]MCW2308162.1 riboflavin kinase/FMN adenylyltransferase [Rhodobium gokarnense]
MEDVGNASKGRFVHAAGLDAVPAAVKGGVVAIGNFDGVHRGHQAVLERAVTIARDKGVPALAMTFEPHPRRVFRPDLPLFRLTPPNAKARVIEAIGLDGVVVVPFDRDFAAVSAEDFIEDILLERLKASHVVVGYNFHFGKGRAGSPSFLEEAGTRFGFGVTVADAFGDEGGASISSSRVRAALEEGDVTGAASLLGYRWFIEEEIVHGDKRGRELGFPTANMKLPGDCGLAHGIYAVRMRVDGVLYDGAASYGRRPTFGDGIPLLEVFLFDFDGDLYGKTVDVTFVSYLRAEEKFDSIEALIAQMTRDTEEARMVLSGLAPLSALDAALAFS